MSPSEFADRIRVLTEDSWVKARTAAIYEPYRLLAGHVNALPLPDLVKEVATLIAVLEEEPGSDIAYGPVMVLRGFNEYQLLLTAAMLHPMRFDDHETANNRFISRKSGAISARGTSKES